MFLSGIQIFIFLLSCIGPLPQVQADEFRLPAPGVMVHLSPEFNPPILKGIKVHPDNPFRFDFILDQGDGVIPKRSVIPTPSTNGRSPEGQAGIQNQEQLKQEATRLIKYFLASLTIPEKDLWVNLSPYEKDRIIPQSFGLTEMGRDLLAEDYMLKQITASLIYPEDGIGKKFWKRIYEEAAKKFGTTNIPVNTFNKVWIVPEKAVVYENAKAGTAYVVESKLKVMLEEDYLSLEKHECRGDACHRPQEGRPQGSPLQNNVNALGSQIVREIVIPELTKEVNEDKNFAQLRQVYNSLILATWYKKKIKDSILAQVYADKNKTAGVQYTSTVIPKSYAVIPAKGRHARHSQLFAGIQKKDDVDLIYQRYLQAFKKGVYNYIKEEQDPVTQQAVPRKYFSGGTTFDAAAMASALIFKTDAAVLSQSESDRAQVVVVELGQVPEDQAMITDSIFKRAVQDRLKKAKTYDQITVLDYGPKDKKLIINILKSMSKPFIEITKENLSTLLDAKEDHNKGTDIFIAPANLRFANKNQVLRFLEIIGLEMTVGPAFTTMGDVSKRQGDYFSQPYKDPLTGLNNRDGFKESPIVKRAISGKSHIYMAILDIDHFKAINELFGHDVGDEVLKIFAENLKSSLRAGDVVARWGGEEFVLLLPVTKEAHDVPERIHGAIREKAYRGIPFKKDELIKKLRSPVVANNPAVYEGLIYQLSLQNKDVKLTDFDKFKNLKALVDEVDRVGSRYKFDGWFLTSSMGAVEFDEGKNTFSGEGGRVEDLVAKADKNLSYAKGNGKNQVVSGLYHDQAMKSQGKVGPEGQAMLEKGGIDLTPANMNLQTKMDSRFRGNDREGGGNDSREGGNDNGGIKFHLDPAMLAQLQNAPGFVPVIINIQPLKSLREFLEIASSFRNDTILGIKNS